jgi:hypothetical protein
MTYKAHCTVCTVVYAATPGAYGMLPEVDSAVCRRPHFGSTTVVAVLQGGALYTAQFHNGVL